MKRLVIVHRHGQRAPGKSLMRDDGNLWSQLCAININPDKQALLEKRYPIMLHKSNQPPPDLLSKPFGNLSNIGVAHMTSVGEKLAATYVNIEQEASSQYKSIKAYATNYTRTQVRHFHSIFFLHNLIVKSFGFHS